MKKRNNLSKIKQQRELNYWQSYWKLDTRIYHIWHGMQTRCRSDKNYAGKGIIICDAWKEFINFFNWAICHGYADDLTIERKDNSKGYNPDNCYWATRIEQANNTSQNIKITIGEITKNVGQWLKINKINWNTYCGRLKRGWSRELAATKPTRKKTKSINSQIRCADIK